MASVMQQVARVLLELGGRMTYFKMTKLMYLIYSPGGEEAWTNSCQRRLLAADGRALAS